MSRRHGIWKCPNCLKHQIWKIRSSSTTKLDRNAWNVTLESELPLDRSSRAKVGRNLVQIWERSPKLTDDDLNREVEVRDSQEELHTSKENIVGEEVHIQFDYQVNLC